MSVENENLKKIKQHLKDELTILKNRELELSIELEKHEKYIEDEKKALEEMRELINIIEEFIGE